MRKFVTVLMASLLVASGAVRVEIAEELELADVRRAHALSESGHARGKIVLTVPA